jgi:phage terminase Nu1 subunit (DNA packaging protein)
MGVMAPVEGKKRSVNSIAKLLGCALRTVQDWQARGMPTEDPDCWVWIFKHQRKRIEDRSGGGDLDEEEQRQKIAVLKERKMTIRMERRRRKGELVERVAVQRQWKRKITEAKVQIESIPAMAAQYVPDGEMRAIVQEEAEKVVVRALKGLARGKSGES